MYLKKLTLRGFKSFASTTSISLEPGITCVVGPNGSGKSNVVDALAWVMGEQGAKSLRGGSMEDVIFAGTSSRSPLGRAEIQLTIDNSDGALPIDYSEVTISRTKFRNGNSEYAINGTQCRLLDVRELLSDSGIGREMHVIVGQGELDQILQATPETRRGFVEEAAGVLKHRERKEKALRKLEATQVNLNRLTDLISEIRRQLKPLGRQAEVAKRASLVQADLRDAKARLLADDLSQAQQVLVTEIADEQSIRARREQVEADLTAARVLEDESRAAMIDKDAAYRKIQEIWFSLSGVAERVRSTVSLAEERVRNAEAMPSPTPNPDRDPETLMAQAEKILEGEVRLREEIAKREKALSEATEARIEAEAIHSEAEKEYTHRVRASSDRREGLARLNGELTSVKARIEAGNQRLETLHKARTEAELKAKEASDHVQVAEAEVPDALEPTHVGTLRDEAQATLEEVRTQLDSAKTAVQAVTEVRAGLLARSEALTMALHTDRDGATWVAEESGISGVMGSLASMVSVEAGYDRAVAAALGVAGEAIVVADYSASVGAVDALRAKDRGRAGLLITSKKPATEVPVIEGARSVISVLSADTAVMSSLAHLLGSTYVVASLSQAKTLVEKYPEARFVTTGGDTASAVFVTGGSASKQSAIQIGIALSEAESQLATTTDELSKAESYLHEVQGLYTQAQEGLDQAQKTLKDAEAAYGAVSEKLARLKQISLLANADLERLGEQVEAAEKERETASVLASELEQRLVQATATEESEEPDSSKVDELAEAAKRARSAEMEARLGLRTVEERVRSLSGQAEALRKTADTERAAREEAERRREILQRQADVARGTAEVGQWLYDRVCDSQSLAEREREAMGLARTQAETQAEHCRIRARDLSAELEAIVDSVHRDELALAQQKMRIDALGERAMAEVGIDTETLMNQYGPDQLIPVGEPDPETGETQTIPFVREEQMKRLRTAERDLQLLGRINPLALEEFDAMQERHQFLSTQLEDLKKTRSDLLSIVDDVDSRVQEVFAQAYTDVEREFKDTFARLFPGGEGRLVLTEPGEWLTTGIEVEARPAGKNVKRLSLLSGGERSLVAVCFLVSLFKARPSPFYVLDEVEAALDDANVGRLLGVYEELRQTSQLVVITHQKRTMEIADTLYGVTMGSDGTSTVISQRLRED
ncbi:MAG: chromosome segregation protein SMC [Propionibacteriaceae bacterium]|jgi:chromosome segregation protein|nr:chromosome segregation protein SMC [Propionibacteriaceae bacterium]